MSTVALVVALVLGAHAVLKLLFFLLPYGRRRAALDRAYAGRTGATRASDAASLVIVAAAVIVLLIGGIAPVSFLIGLWAGATLIQVYFHRYHEPVAEDRAAPPPTSPIKTMSYAIQAAPGRPWREMVLLVLLVLCVAVAVVALVAGAR